MRTGTTNQLTLVAPVRIRYLVSTFQNYRSQYELRMWRHGDDVITGGWQVVLRRHQVLDARLTAYTLRPTASRDQAPTTWRRPDGGPVSTVILESDRLPCWSRADLADWPTVTPTAATQITFAMSTKSDLQSFDFVINRFCIKLFTTKNIEIVKYCQEYFGFDLPSVFWAKCVSKFESSLKCFCVLCNCVAFACIRIVYSSTMFVWWIKDFHKTSRNKVK